MHRLCGLCHQNVQTLKVLILVLVEDGLGEQLLEMAVSETVAMKFLISLTFGDQKYVPFWVLSRMQIYEFSVSMAILSENNSASFMSVFIRVNSGRGKKAGERDKR